MQKEHTAGQFFGWLGKLKKLLRENRKAEFAAYAGIVLLAAALYLIGNARSDGLAEERAAATVPSGTVTTANMETRLRQVLSQIRGAGEVEVMITYETGKEIVTAMTTSSSINSSESDVGGGSSRTNVTDETKQPATIDGTDGNEPIILYEKEPKIRGVIIVADGAADVAVRLDLQRAAQAVLDVSLSAIEVFERSADRHNEEQ